MPEETRIISGANGLYQVEREVNGQRVTGLLNTLTPVEGTGQTALFGISWQGQENNINPTITQQEIDRLIEIFNAGQNRAVPASPAAGAPGTFRLDGSTLRILGRGDGENEYRVEYEIEVERDGRRVREKMEGTLDAGTQMLSNPPQYAITFPGKGPQGAPLVMSINQWELNDLLQHYNNPGVVRSGAEPAPTPPPTAAPPQPGANPAPSRGNGEQSTGNEITINGVTFTRIGDGDVIRISHQVEENGVTTSRTAYIADRGGDAQGETWRRLTDLDRRENNTTIDRGEIDRELRTILRSEPKALSVLPGMAQNDATAIDRAGRLSEDQDMNGNGSFLRTMPYNTQDRDGQRAMELRDLGRGDTLLYALSNPPLRLNADGSQEMVRPRGMPDAVHALDHRTVSAVEAMRADARLDFNPREDNPLLRDGGASAGTGRVPRGPGSLEV